MHAPTGGARTPQPQAIPSLEVTGTAISEGSFSTGTCRTSPGIPKSPSGKIRGFQEKGRIRPSDVYAAALSEVGNADNGIQAKVWSDRRSMSTELLRSLRVRSASPSAQLGSPSYRQNHAQHAPVPGLLPVLLPPSSPGGSSGNPRSPFHRTISSRPSEKEQPPSILSALDQGMNRNTARTPRYAGQEGVPSVANKRTASAPDSQSARLFQQELLRRQAQAGAGSIAGGGGVGGVTSGALSSMDGRWGGGLGSGGREDANWQQQQQQQQQQEAGGPATSPHDTSSGMRRAANRPPPLRMGLNLLGGPQENLNLLSSPTKPPPTSRLLLGQQQEGMRLPGSPSKAPPLRPLANPANINACVYQNGETPASSNGNSSSASSSPTKQIPPYPHLRAPSAQGQQRLDLPDSVVSEIGYSNGAGFVKASSPPGVPPSHHRLASASKVDSATPASATLPHAAPPASGASGGSPSKARTPSPAPVALGPALPIDSQTQQQQQQQQQVGQIAGEGGGGAGHYVLRPPVRDVGGPGGQCGGSDSSIIGATVGPASASRPVSGTDAGLPEGNNPIGSSGTTAASFTRFVPRPPPPDSSLGAPRPPSADIVAHVSVVNAVSDASKAGIVYGGNLVPRPPSGEAGPDYKGLPHVRTRRRSSRLSSPVESKKQDGSPMCGASPQTGRLLQGELQRTPSTQAYQDTASLISRAQSLTSMGSNQTELSSPAPTPGSAHRPNSGRTRAVQFLVDAVRSKDSARFQDALDYLRLPNGTVAGLNEHHSVTGRTPLHEAVMLNNMSTVQRLLEAGAQPNRGHMSQGPPLLHAAAWGEADMVELLLGAGADVRAHDIAGHTALHYACSGGHALAAQALLRKGADINAKNEDGDTPMELAEHHPTLQSLLRSWSPAMATSTSGTATATTFSRANTSHAGSTAGGTASAARAGSGGAPFTPGNSLAPSPPQSSRQSSGHAGDVRVGATPVPRGHKMQVQAQQVYMPGGLEQVAQGGGAGQQQHQNPHLHHQSHHHLSHNQGQQVLRQHTPYHHGVQHPQYPTPFQQQQQQPMLPQPPGYSSMSVRKHSKRPNLGRSLSLASADSPASAARAAGLQAPESSSDAPSGSEGSPDPQASPIRPHSKLNNTRLYPSLPSSGRGTVPNSSSHLQSPLLSPLSNDGEDRAGGRMPSPPKLELPRNVRRQLSKGAVLQDILHAFEEEDLEVVRRFSTYGSVDSDAEGSEDGEGSSTSPQRALTPPSAAATPSHQQPSVRPQQTPQTPSIMFGFPPTPSPQPAMLGTSPAAPTPPTLTPQPSSHAQADNVNSTKQHHQGSYSKEPASTIMSPQEQLACAIPRAPRFRFGVELAITPTSPPIHPEESAWEARLLAGMDVGAPRGPKPESGPAQAEAFETSAGSAIGPTIPDVAARLVNANAELAGAVEEDAGRKASATPLLAATAGAGGNSPPVADQGVQAGTGAGSLGGSKPGGVDQLCPVEEAHTNGGSSSSSSSSAAVNGVRGRQSCTPSRLQQSTGVGDCAGEGPSSLHAEISLGEAVPVQGDTNSAKAPLKINLTESGDIGPPLVSDSSPVSTPRGNPSAAAGVATTRRRPLPTNMQTHSPAAGAGMDTVDPSGNASRPSSGAAAGSALLPSGATGPNASSSKGGSSSGVGKTRDPEDGASPDGPGESAFLAPTRANAGESRGSSGRLVDAPGTTRRAAGKPEEGSGGKKLPPRKGKGAGGQCMAARRIAAAATAAAAQWAREGGSGENGGGGAGGVGALYASGGVPPLRISQAAQAMVAQVERASAAAAMNASGSGSGSGGAWRASGGGSGSHSSSGGGGGNGGVAVTRASHDALQLRAVAMFTRSMDIQTGSMQWTRGELLGEGSFGRVYAGLNQQTGELMAVKELELVTRHKAGLQSTVMQQLQELQQELELYKNLQHMHVVTYIDHHFDKRRSTLYIFLEYVPGGSIASMLDRFGKFSEELVRNYTRQLLLGLEYLHSCRVCHRDLKGGNVLVTRDGVVKLADFGASKAFQGDTITEGMKSIKGSAFWMAPEVIKGTGYNFKADIWSLGCTVIEMLTGRHPWPELENALTAMFQIAKTTSGPPRPISASHAALDFLDCCLRVDPHDRLAASQLLQHPWLAGR